MSGDSSGIAPRGPTPGSVRGSSPADDSSASAAQPASTKDGGIEGWRAIPAGTVGDAAVRPVSPRGSAEGPTEITGRAKASAIERGGALERSGFSATVRAGADGRPTGAEGRGSGMSLVWGGGGVWEKMARACGGAA